MKKLLILSIFFMLPACACFDCQDDGELETAYRGYDAEGCNYYNGTCHREPQLERKVVNTQEIKYREPEVVRYRREEPVVYYRNEAPVRYVRVERPAPQPVYYAPQRTVEVVVDEPAPTPIVNTVKEVKTETVTSTATANVSTANVGPSCAPKVEEKREPVEIVFKKTTSTTVYEPKTTVKVTYEKEPYVGQILK